MIVDAAECAAQRRGDRQPGRRGGRNRLRIALTYAKALSDEAGWWTEY